MKALYPSSDVLCTPHINLYDCAGHIPLSYAAAVCATVSSLTFLFGLVVILYRWHHGILTELFRRVNGYWIPVPLDILIVVICPVEALRCIMYILVLLDWPKSMVFRNVLGMAVLILLVFAVTLFVSGIIAHIPPVFTRTSWSKSKIAVTCGGPCKLFVPSTRVVYWTTVVFCTLILLLGFCTSAIVGWGEEHGLAAVAKNAHKGVAFTLAISILIMFIVNGYYSYGFYKILCSHVERSSSQGLVNGAEIDAARRFRNIDVLSEQISRILWWNVTFSVIRYGVFFPGIQWILYYNIFQSSQVRVHRATSHAAATKTGASEMFSSPCHSIHQATAV
ncbi:hypothetical protein BDF19DRAFT_457246 [Syncephalis fuscata]|nr:hypothetical protein BDF19DRAFT_457246 [Syncephalis fuscata]